VALEFLFGMLLCAWFLRNTPLNSRSAKTFAAAGLLALLLLPDTKGPDVLLFGLPASLLVFGAASMRQLTSSLWSFLGAASYSIYLVQVFAIPAFYKLAAHPLNAIGGDAVAILAVLATLAAGCALHICIERPLARALAGNWLRNISLSEPTPLNPRLPVTTDHRNGSTARPQTAWPKPSSAPAAGQP
jgi:peptidoglycan/LPS O-acetylase OafA/YrhL